MHFTTKCVMNSYNLLDDRRNPHILGTQHIREIEIRQGSYRLKTRGDVLIRGLWDKHTEAIINVKLGDTDIPTGLRQ